MNETVFGIGFVVTIAASFVFAVFVGAKDPLEIEKRPTFFHALSSTPDYPEFRETRSCRPRIICVHQPIYQRSERYAKD